MTADPTNELIPPKQYRGLRWHWLIREGQRVPAGWESDEGAAPITMLSGGRWALADGNIFPPSIGYARGWRYDRPLAELIPLPTEADVERISEIIRKRLHKDGFADIGAIASDVLTALKET